MYQNALFDCILNSFNQVNILIIINFPIVFSDPSNSTTLCLCCSTLLVNQAQRDDFLPLPRSHVTSDLPVELSEIILPALFLRSVLQIAPKQPLRFDNDNENSTWDTSLFLGCDYPSSKNYFIYHASTYGISFPGFIN